MPSSAEPAAEVAPALLLLPRERLAEAWPLLLPHLARFEMMAAGRDTLAAARTALEEGRWLAWLIVSGPALRAVALTEVRHAAGGLVEHVVHWLGGRGMARWLPLVREMEDAARNWGCTRMTWRGRHGWARAMRRHGYRPTLTIMEKVLAPSSPPL